MTVLVCISQDEDGHVLRRWERSPKSGGKLFLSHEGGIEGYLYQHTVQDFAKHPPAGTRIGFANENERGWEPTAA